MCPMNMSIQCTLGLIPACTLLARLAVHMCANIWLDFQMLTLDMRLEGLGLSERFITRRIFDAVELGFVYILVPLQPPVGSEALPASIPIADECSLSRRIAVGILNMTL